ncbi:MAG: N-formylglutamate amidohydrolase [Pseudomonadota bacterium]
MDRSASRMAERQGLLTPQDPPPAEVLEGEPGHPVLVVCEHAGRAIPAALHGLGLPAEALEGHQAWDIGAAGVTRRLAARLGAAATLQPYSRLVIDCNRPPDAPDAMPAVSHGLKVPGNRPAAPEANGADDRPADHVARVREIFEPFQAEVARLAAAPGRRLLLSVHSFTRQLSGRMRPWRIGLCYRRDAETSARLAAALTARAPDLILGMNQPYGIDDAADWFVPRHGEATGLPHSLIELRNDLIAATQGQDRWADLLADAVQDLMQGPSRC